MYFQTLAVSEYLIFPMECSTEASVPTVTGLLGAMAGLLVALLALTNIALVWTCYIMKKRGKIIEHLKAR